MEWFEKYSRTGALPDGRRPFNVHMAGSKVYVCFDPSVMARANENKSIPAPGEVADDGYITPMGRIYAAQGMRPSQANGPCRRHRTPIA